MPEKAAVRALIRLLYLPTRRAFSRPFDAERFGSLTINNQFKPRRTKIAISTQGDPRH